MNEKRITVVVESEHDPVAALHQVLETGSNIDDFRIEEHQEL